ncbi:NlpC/P60 family protein [Streptomyces niveiscabiei]|uniref:C40 family peptidase n=1 Tax=Streptomyces niveiscabiei TaxID=164115 RepID=UPI0029BC38C7|nr:NlpC/P60 family protein [Streptomyces niveiscabiei]MDX3386742.1 NlpC/P60 family protein [Streptomyces niveiscabiei]
MSGRLLRLACTAALVAQVALVPAVAVGAPEPPERTVAELLTELQRVYREAESATEAYNATEERLKKKRAEVAKLDAELVRARLALDGSRDLAGRLARQQYQSRSDISPYVRLLLAKDPQRALDEGHIIGQLARDRASATTRLAQDEHRRDTVTRTARTALDAQLALTARKKKARDDVRSRLDAVQRLLATLTPDQLTRLARLERAQVDDRQRKFLADNDLAGPDSPTSPEGEQAVRYAMDQVGKPYETGAAGPAAYDNSGLAATSWGHAGARIPRTAKEQWARLPRVPLKQLRPGDLVLYHPEATHVAVYVGKGKVVQAPGPGGEVKVTPIATAPVLGAVRPV